MFPIAPGAAGGVVDTAGYAFVNFGADEVIADLEIFLTQLKAINPRAQVILTVSPVPLVATYEPRHVLVSTVASKSILRVAADTIQRRHAHVDYFPSYEIVTGGFSRGAYFGPDLRSIQGEGVDHVMRVFMRHYSVLTDATTPTTDRQAGPMQSALAAEMLQAREIVCEEELLDL